MRELIPVSRFSTLVLQLIAIPVLLSSFTGTAKALVWESGTLSGTNTVSNVGGFPELSDAIGTFSFNAGVDQVPGVDYSAQNPGSFDVDVTGFGATGTWTGTFSATNLLFGTTSGTYNLPFGVPVGNGDTLLMNGPITFTTTPPAPPLPATLENLTLSATVTISNVTRDGFGNLISYDFAGTFTLNANFPEPRQPYWVWELGSIPFLPVSVDLSDQFNDLSVAVDRRDYLMNPVNKTGVSPPVPTKEIVDPDLHYSWNRIDPPPKPGATQVRQVRITDQFGVNLWVIRRKPTYLLAPTDKCLGIGCPLGLGPAPLNQHYACYEAVKSPFIGDLVSLQDQFEIDDPNTVGLGRWICAPVEKTKGPNNFPITNSGLHLSCYDVDPTLNTLAWEARDQFGEFAFAGSGQTDAFLCVDAVKQLPLSQVPSMGRWGLATLGGLMGLLTVVWYARRRSTGGQPA